LGELPEDFAVDEIPAYPFSGAGEHWFVRIEKRSLTTPEALHTIARAAGVSERDLGCAGMKDKHAVTTQWVSLPGRARAPESWTLPENVRVLEVTRHGNKLRTGQLSGNRFRLRLRGAAPADEARARAITEALATRGLPNYFGPQRFGRDGNNFAAAVDWLAGGARLQGPRARFYRKLYPSVIQSEIFNRYLTLRTQRGLDTLQPGEVVRLAHSRAVFLVEDAAQEQPRLSAREIRLTGPMPGPRMRAAEGMALELEREAREAAGVSEEQLAALAEFVDGTRRDLLVWPEELQVDREAEDVLVVAFTLPSGSYATQVLRELTHAAWRETGVRGGTE
jgi:tRNA pseudouridine13 synthase